MSSSAAREDDVILPVLEYGYRKSPLEWPELQEIIASGELARLARSENQQRDYEIYKKHLKAKWRSIYDFVLVDKFGLTTKRDNETGLLYAYPPFSELKNEVKRAFVLNDFPYCMAQNIEHWILWKLGEDCTERDITDAKQELQTKLGDVIDLLHWINPPHLKSLPEIDHVHILCLRRA